MGNYIISVGYVRMEIFIGFKSVLDFCIKSLRVCDVQTGQFGNKVQPKFGKRYL